MVLCCRSLRALHSVAQQSSGEQRLSRTGSANTLAGLLSRMHSMESPLDGNGNDPTGPEQISFMSHASHASVWTMTQGVVDDSVDSGDIFASGARSSLM